MGKDPAVEFHGVSKRFGAVDANRDVSFSVAAGTIHGLLGENGAGKSTIMKILYGIYPADAGEIRLAGEAVRFRSPRDAIARGIGMVHQHFLLVPRLLGWENVVLGDGRAWLDRRRLLLSLRERASALGVTAPLDVPVEELSVGEQQQLELLRILSAEPRLLILDEPTAVLTPQESAGLFVRLRALRAGGTTILIVTHKLGEIVELTDRVTVMRHGTVVETGDTASHTEASLAERIIGRKREAPRREVLRTGEPLLRTRALEVPHGGRSGLHGVDLEVRAGEIVGIAGIEGNGQDALVESLAGVADYQGSIELLGHERRLADPYALRQDGLAVIPPDRHSQGGVLGFSLAENACLGHHRETTVAVRGWHSPGRLRENAARILAAGDVRPADPDLLFKSLSGGNQQKLILEREISSKPRLVIASHPTRGVDIGAADAIHSRLLELVRAGAGVLLLSADLDEILLLSDRIVVLAAGRVRGETPRATASEAQLGLWMAGGEHA